MMLWVDAQLSPTLAPWLTEKFGIEAYSIKWLGYRNATDGEIFYAARAAGAVVMTKDSDFLRLLDQHGPPPQVLWITFGNTSNARMKEVLQRIFPWAVKLLEAGEPLVEISQLAVRNP